MWNWVLLQAREVCFRVYERAGSPRLKHVWRETRAHGNACCNVSKAHASEEGIAWANQGRGARQDDHLVRTLLSNRALSAERPRASVCSAVMHASSWGLAREAEHGHVTWAFRALPLLRDYTITTSAYYRARSVLKRFSTLLMPLSNATYPRREARHLLTQIGPSSNPQIVTRSSSKLLLYAW